MRSADLIRELKEGRLGLKTRSRLAPRVHSSSTAWNRGCATPQARIGRRPCRRHPQASWHLMMRYPIAIESRTDRSAYGVVVPDLPGCFSAGDTLEEAIAGAEEASLAWIDAALDAGDPIPRPRRSRPSARSRNSPAGSFRSSPSIRRFSTTPSSASTSRCRAGSCGAWMTKRALRARRDRATSRSSPSNIEKARLKETEARCQSIRSVIRFNCPPAHRFRR